MATVQDNRPPEISFAQHIGTRDGTLATDGKLVNFYMEETPEGKVAVKRPGLRLQKSIPTGSGQCLVNQGNTIWAVVNNVLYDIIGIQPNTNMGFGPLGTSFTANRILENQVIGGVTYSLIQGPFSLWSFTSANIGGTAPAVSDVNFPPNLTISPRALTPSLCELDGTYYVQTATGVIYGSNVGTFNTWTALNTVSPSFAFKSGTGLIRHLNYLVAFYDSGLQFYYDNANPPPGSPLLPAQNASFGIGCMDGFSAVELNDVTYFIGTNLVGNRSVYKIVGLQLQEISSPFVNRVLQLITLNQGASQTPNFICSGVQISGHKCYLINIRNLQITLVYDTEIQDWYVWTSLTSGNLESFFQGFIVHQDFLGTYCLNAFGNEAYKLDSTVYQDYVGGTTRNINCLVRTIPYDWGTLNQKRYAAMFLHADTVSATMQVRYSDDDYATYSSYRTLDLNTKRKMLQRLGRARRRSWDFLHTANTPLRLYKAELHMNVGPG